MDEVELSSRRKFVAMGGAGVTLGVLAALNGAPPARADSTVTSVNARTGQVTLNSTDLSGMLAPSSIVIAAPPQVDGDGDPTDSRGTLQQAIDATPEGGTLIIPAGDYYLQSTATAGEYLRATRGIRILAYGARFFCVAGGGLFFWAKYALELTQNGDSIEPVLLNAAGSIEPEAGDDTVPGTKLTFKNDSTTWKEWKQGDVIKLVADDFIADARTPSTTGARVGQTFVVAADANPNDSYVLLGGSPEAGDIFDDNIRAARFGGKTAVWCGGEIRRNPTDSASSTMRIDLATGARVQDVVIHSPAGPGFEFDSCLGFLVDNCQVQYAVNDAPAKLGYGVFNKMSVYGTVRNSTFFSCRHGYSDDVERIAANVADLSKYGRPSHTTVVDSSAVAATSSAWSPHHGAFKITFDNCGASDSLAGFGARGIGITFRGGTMVNCLTAMNVLVEGGGQTRDILFEGTRVDGCDSVVSHFPGAGGPPVTDVTRVQNIYATGIRRRIVRSRKGQISFDLCRFEMNSDFQLPVADEPGLFVTHFSQLTVRRSTVSTQPLTTPAASTIRLFFANDDGASNVDVSDLILLNKAGDLAGLVLSLHSDTLVTADVRLEVMIPVASSAVSPASVMSPASQVIRRTRSDSGLTVSLFRQDDAIVSAATMAEIQGLNGTAVIDFTVKGTSNLRAITLPSPARSGQMLVITSVGSATIRVKAAATTILLGGTDKDLASNQFQSIVLVSGASNDGTGTVWRQRGAVS